MAQINKTALRADVVHAGEYGNTVTEVRTVKCKPDNGDTVHFMRLPAFTRLLDLQVFHGAAGGSAAASFGYVPDTGDAQPTYFTGSKSLVAAGRIRADSTNAPVVTGSAVDIVAAVGADFANEVDLTVVATYDWINR